MMSSIVVGYTNSEPPLPFEILNAGIEVMVGMEDAKNEASTARPNAPSGAAYLEVR